MVHTTAWASIQPIPCTITQHCLTWSHKYYEYIVFRGFEVSSYAKKYTHLCIILPALDWQELGKTCRKTLHCYPYKCLILYRPCKPEYRGRGHQNTFSLQVSGYRLVRLQYSLSIAHLPVFSRPLKSIIGQGELGQPSRPATDPSFSIDRPENRTVQPWL